MPDSRFKRITWKRAFDEGEKKIKTLLPGTLSSLPKRERAALLGKREGLQNHISLALEKQTPAKLRNAMNEQLGFILLLEGK